MLGLLRYLCSVKPWEELVEACDLVVGGLGEDPCETGFRIHVVELCGLDLSRIYAAPSARLGHFPFAGDRAFPTQC